MQYPFYGIFVFVHVAITLNNNKYDKFLTGVNDSV